MKDNEFAKHILLEHSCYNCIFYFPHNNKCETVSFLGPGWKDIPKSRVCADYIYITVEHIIENTSSML